MQAEGLFREDVTGGEREGDKRKGKREAWLPDENGLIQKATSPEQLHARLRQQEYEGRGVLGQKEDLERLWAESAQKASRKNPREDSDRKRWYFGEHIEGLPAASGALPAHQPENQHKEAIASSNTSKRGKSPRKTRYMNAVTRPGNKTAYPSTATRLREDIAARKTTDALGKEFLSGTRMPCKAR